MRAPSPRPKPVALLWLWLVGTGLLFATLLGLWPGANPPPPPDPVDSSVQAMPEVLQVATAEASASLEETDLAEPELEPERALDRAGTSAEGILVTVTHQQPAVPAAGATIYFVTESQAQRALSNAAAMPSSDWPVRLGQRLLADAMGQAKLPTTKEPWLVAATLEDQFASGRMHWRRPELRLHLQRDETLTVQIRREDRGPVGGVPFALLHYASPQSDEPSVFWHSTCDDQGVAIVPHLQELRPQLQADERFFALLKLPTQEPIQTAFAGRPAQREPVELLCPPLGQLAARVVDHAGNPILSRAELSVWPHGKQPRHRARADATRALRAEKPLGDTLVPLPGAPLGAELSVLARFPYDWGPSSLLRTSVTTADATQQIQLQLADAKAVVAGRLRYEDGSPVARQKVALIAWRGPRALFELAVETIDDGRFDLVVEPHGGKPDDRLELRLAVQEEASQQVLGAAAGAAELIARERRELGDLVLRPLPMLAVGTIRNDLDEPLPGASAQLQMLVQEEGKSDWRNVPGYQVAADANGNFALFGPRPAGQLRLHGARREHFDGTAEFPAPGQLCHLRLLRHGILVGRALLPACVDDGMMELLLVPNNTLLDDRAKRAGTLRTPLRKGRLGRFWIAPLQQQSYDAVISLRGVQAPLLTIQGVLGQPGIQRDPRLNVLDLRQALFQYRLRLVDAAGMPMAINAPLLARSRDGTGERRFDQFRFVNGRAEVLSPEPMLEFTAFAPGCPPTTQALPQGEHALCMQRQLPAVVTLPGTLAQCGPQRKIRLSAVYTGQTGFPEWLYSADQRSGEQFGFPRWELGKSGGAWFLDSDTVEMALALAGEYELTLRVYATQDTNSRQVALPLGKHRLSLTGSNGAITVAVDSNQLAKLLSQLDLPVKARQR